MKMNLHLSELINTSGKDPIEVCHYPSTFLKYLGHGGFLVSELTEAEIEHLEMKLSNMICSAVAADRDRPRPISKN